MATDTCRRRYHRFPAERRVWWERECEDIAITVVNVSVGGVMARFPETLPKAQRLNLQFQFPHLEEFVLCRCRVVHSEPSAVKGMHDVGLEILELDGIDPVEFTHRLAKQVAPVT